MTPLPPLSLPSCDSPLLTVLAPLFVLHSSPSPWTLHGGSPSWEGEEEGSGQLEGKGLRTGEACERTVSSSVCEVTEGLPGWSPAFSLEIPGLHGRKEPALFITWPEPSLAPSPPCQGLGGATRPRLLLWKTTPTPSLWPSQLSVRPRARDPCGHQENQPLRTSDLLPAHAARDPDFAAFPP